MKNFDEFYESLWDNIRKKKGTSRPKGHPKAPSEDDLKRAAQTAKENVKEDGHTAVAKVKNAIKDRKTNNKEKDNNKNHNYLGLKIKSKKNFVLCLLHNK